MTDNTSVRLDVFGRRITVVLRGDRWQAYYTSGDGKRCPVDGLVIPANRSETEMIRYVADICHEWASPSHSEVFVLSESGPREEH